MIDVTDKWEDTKELLKTRIYTDFCDRCPNYRKDLTGCCDYIEQTAWDCVFEDKDVEQAVNKFTCFFNVERLTLTKGG